jgi:hypothetical protein
MNCCICGPVKNCAPYLARVFENIEQIGTLFNDYKIIIYYDKSDDNTLEMLKQYQNKNNRLYFYVNKNPVSSFRTHNIAIARNYCLRYVRENVNYFPFFIMMDFDDVNCKNINVEPIKKCLLREDWDGLSFNTSPKYYDIWGLSIYPYCFSYNHFENNVQNYYIIQNYVTNLLNNLPPGKLQQCISSFNGFSIYRTNKFLNTYYDGRIRTDLIPHENMIAHSRAAKSKLVYKKYVTVDGRYEDCEHRAFHIQATKNSGAQIRISPETLFL